MDPSQTESIDASRSDQLEAADSEQEGSFCWREHWYPISFLQDFDDRSPYGFEIYDQPFVLFRDENGAFVCLEDRCPHRAAKLSDGQVCNGKIECLYHGWKFAGSGDCVEIPQLPAEAAIPSRAHVQSFEVREAQGIIWVWASDQVPAEPALLPLVPAADKEKVHFIDYQMDLPYDQTYLIENVIDIAHIHVAHHGVKGGGHRSHAKPLEFKVLEESQSGIVAQFKTVGFENRDPKTKLKDARVSFRAPNTIEYESDFVDDSRCAGLVLYCLPIGKERCRLLYRAYNNFVDQSERNRPRWKEHLNQMHLLEQDMAVVTGQYQQVENDARALKEQWLPLHSSDLLVIKYRQWLDRCGEGIPFYVGWSKRKATTSPGTKLASNRWELHTRICDSCKAAHHSLTKWRTRLFLSSIGSLGLAAILGHSIGSALLCGIAATCFAFSHHFGKLCKKLTD